MSTGCRRNCCKGGHDAEVAAAPAQRPRRGRDRRLQSLRARRRPRRPARRPARCLTPGRTSPSARPSPPPSVSPAITVVEIAPPVTARPCLPVASFSSLQLRPPSARTVRASASTSVPFISEGRSSPHRRQRPARPGDSWPPPRTRTVEAGSPREAHAGSDVGCASAADDHGRRPVDEAVEDLAMRCNRRPQGSRAEPGNTAGDIWPGVRSQESFRGYLPVGCAVIRPGARMYHRPSFSRSRRTQSVTPATVACRRPASSGSDAAMCFAMYWASRPRPGSTSERERVEEDEPEEVEAGLGNTR